MFQAFVYVSVFLSGISDLRYFFFCFIVLELLSVIEHQDYLLIQVCSIGSKVYSLSE